MGARVKLVLRTQGPGGDEFETLNANVVLDFIRIKEIPQKHIVNRWTRDARYILPAHLTQYQRDYAHKNPFSFTHFTVCFLGVWGQKMFVGLVCPSSFSML